MVRSQPRQIVRETLSQKSPSQKRVGGVVQGVGLEFKALILQNKGKKRESYMILNMNNGLTVKSSTSIWSCFGNFLNI
jgi:hypothetical protein